MELSKQLLEGYKYDFQYLEEKSKEIDKLKIEVKKSCERLQELNGNNTPINNLHEKLENILHKQATEEDMLLKIIIRKQSIEEIINRIEQPFKTVLYLRYLRFLTFDQIGDKMHYSTKRIYQLHKIAIEKFASIYEK